MELKDNVILITGGTSGIGLEFASRLIDMGNTVIITGRDQTKLDKAKMKMPQIHTFQSDVSDKDAIVELYEKVTKQFPGLNILINNAGIMRNLNLQDPGINSENITREIETNLLGPVRMVQQFLPHLKIQKKPAIINVSSAIAFVPVAFSPIYCATKAGIHSYTQSLRIQLKDTGIKVFELIPPAINTPLIDAFDGMLKNAQLMEPAKLVDIAIKGIKKDKFEIVPGLSNILKILSRAAPKFALNMLNKSRA